MRRWLSDKFGLFDRTLICYRRIDGRTDGHIAFTAYHAVARRESLRKVTLYETHSSIYDIVTQSSW